MNRAAAVSPLTGVRHWARIDPSREAIVDGPRKLTYAELVTKIEAAASFFVSEGVKQGDVVGMSLRNSTEAVVIPLAAAAVGAQISPVNFRLKARELRRILDFTGAQLFIYGSELQNVVAECKGGEKRGHLTTEDFNASLREFEGTFVEGGFDSSSESYTLLWTSGTRGLPKPCRGSLAARMNWILTLGHVYGVRASDRYLAALPITHSAGMTFALAHLFFGACVYMVARLEPAEVWRLIRREAITSALFVPTMLQMLIEEDPDPRLPVPESLRTIITAGARIRPNLHARILDRFPNRLYSYYGSTESPSMTVLFPQEQEEHRDSVGRPYFGVEIFVRNVRKLPDYDVPVGDIFARSPFAMDEYGVEGVAIPISGEGWIETGDIGYFDEHGYLHVFGRASDVIISGGLNISLPEIERVIAAHPLVRDVVVVGLEDERWGDVPAAVIVPADLRDPVAALEAVDRLCREELAGYKRPRRIVVLDEIPRTASGKPALADIKALILASGETKTVQTR